MHMADHRVLLPVVTLVMCSVSFTLTSAVSTPLDDYVRMPDSHYKYELLKEIHKENYTIHVLNMTSQKWMTEEFSNRPIWWHYVNVIIPKQIIVKDTALLVITQGHNSDETPDLFDKFLDMGILLSVTTQTIVVQLDQIPNQPIVFKNDPLRRGRTEDSLQAWSWWEFLKKPTQPEAIIQLPMTKAVVRAMDTVGDYTKKVTGHAVDKFVLTGASKRGWVTWLTAAMDQRVIGMAPIVFDLLNMRKALHHHFRSLKGWSFAFKPYFEANITQALDTPNFGKMCDIIDPLVYKDRFKMPTYILKATGDEFFMLDETRFFYNQLPHSHYLRVFPNCEHSMIGQITDVLLSLRGFYLHLLQRATFPKVTWEMTSSKVKGTIRVKMDTEPLSVTSHHARTLFDGRRDFRLLKEDPRGKGHAMLHPVFWFKGQVTQLTPTEYEVTVMTSSRVWKAFFIEVMFTGADNSVLAFSTEVNVIPDTLPFPDCHLRNCTGTLV